MAEYNIVTMARAYYRAYIEAEPALHLWHRNPGDDITVEPRFDDLAQSERDCIKSGLAGAIRAVEPNARFTGLRSNAEHSLEFAEVSGAPDKTDNERSV